MSAYLLPGLPQPVPSGDGLDTPFWEGLANNQLLLQRCRACRTWLWGPEFICHQCHSDDLVFEETTPEGIIYSHERVWHPVHPALKEQGPYIIVLVELPQAGNVRMVGNLLGDPRQPIAIGARVRGVYEHHLDAKPVFSLLQWATID